MPRPSLRSPSPRRLARLSPLQVFMTCFLTRGLLELPVPELVCAYLEAFKDLRHSVEQAWAALGVVEATRVIDLVAGPVDVDEQAFCPRRVDLSERGLSPQGTDTRAFLATARLRIPLDEARELAAIAAAPLLHLPPRSAEDRATAQKPLGSSTAAQRSPDVSTGKAPLPLPVAPSGVRSAAARSGAGTLEDGLLEFPHPNAQIPSHLHAQLVDLFPDQHELNAERGHLVAEAGDVRPHSGEIGADLAELGADLLEHREHLHGDRVVAVPLLVHRTHRSTSSHPATQSDVTEEERAPVALSIAA